MCFICLFYKKMKNLNLIISVLLSEEKIGLGI